LRQAEVVMFLLIIRSGRIRGAMRLKIWQLLLHVLFLVSLSAHAAAPYGEEWVTCGNLLRKHVASPLIKSEPWERLPGYLDNIEAGTVLFQVDLKSSTYSMDDLMALGESSEDLRIPDALKMFHGTSLVLVANGSREALLQLYYKVKNSAAATNASFHFLNFEGQELETGFPNVVIQIMERASAAVLQKIESEIERQMAQNRSFALYVVDRQQLIFFFPRTMMHPEINSDFWAAEKIRTSWLRNTPSSWVDWVLQKSELLGKRSFIRAGDWAILSPVAYQKSLALTRIAADRQPAVADVDAALRQALQTCFNLTCVVAPPIVAEVTPPATPIEPPNNLMTNPARQRIIELLKEHRRGARLTESGGLKRSFLNLAPLIESGAAQEAYRREIRSIKFTPHDYQMVRSRTWYPGANERFAQAWRAFLKARGSTAADQALSFSNVVRAVREASQVDGPAE